MLTVCLGATQLQWAAPVPGRGEEEGSEPAADAALSFFPYGKITQCLYKSTQTVQWSSNHGHNHEKTKSCYITVISNVDILSCLQFDEKVTVGLLPSLH